MNTIPKQNTFQQTTLLSFPVTQTVGGSYGYQSVPILAYQQQIVAQPQQVWQAKTGPYNTPPTMTAQHPNGGIVCILPENVACLTVDPNGAPGPTTAPSQSCVYGVYYGGGASNGAARGGWSTMDNSLGQQAYFVQQPMQVRVAEVPHQQVTPPATPLFSHQPPPAQISYIQSGTVVQAPRPASQISYAAAAAPAPNGSSVQKNAICRHFLAGRCNRRNCRFVHVLESDTQI